ncbi:MAG: V-type ATP synthase subunit I [Oscillospiraceae bacterium]|nr:V-type ATP synthase subunit I [Oscillospiraceae bacterium]
MAIVKMKRLRLIALENDRTTLLRRLQKLGCLHLSEPPADESAWEGLLRRESDQSAQQHAQLRLLQNALDVLKRYAPQKTGLLDPRPMVSEQEFLNEQELPGHLAAAKEVTDHAAELNRLIAQETRLTGERASLNPWRELDLPMEMTGTKTVNVITGTVPGPVNFDQLQGQLADQVPEAVLYRLSQSSEQQCLLLMCHKAVANQALEVLRNSGFATGQLSGWRGTVAENAQRLDGELERIHRAAEQEKAALVALGDKQEELRLAADRIATELNREENNRRLLTDQHIVCMQGWVPEGDVPRLTGLLEQFDCAWDLADPTEEEYPDVPVQLKGNFFTRSMNCITEQYSLPAYDGVDPNPVMAPFFILFFGMMMADMAYGILMIVGSVLFLKKKRPADTSFMEMIFWCGISTFIFGALTGGFFGDFIPQLLKIINPASTFEMPALFTPLNDTLSIMIGALVLGLIQIITGMTVSVVKKTKDGHFQDALWDEITWWVILAGLALMVLKIGNVGGVPVVLVIGGVMLLYGSTHNARGFGKVTALISAIYNGVTGFFSDTLSYVRLMALMLSGSVIATVFNTLGATFGNVIVFVIVAMIGNILNLLLNLLGCYVHDMRLQFLEFFNRFYKGGGIAYQPLSLQSKNVEIMKEDK